MQFIFEQYSLDTERRELSRRGEQVTMQPQVFDLLVYLVQNRDHVVTKAFYLIDNFPGRYAEGQTWIEALPPAPADGLRPGQATSTTISTSTGASSGRTATPTAERASCARKNRC